MHDLYSQYLNDVLDEALNTILNWSFSQDHPLEQCSPVVKEHVRKASHLADQKRYNEAIDELTKASEKDPKYVGTHVRTMKYLIEDDKPLVALVMCGSALSRSEDVKVHTQALDMASGVAMDFFKKSCDTRDIEQALFLANQATGLAPEDIVSAWNRVEVLIIFEEHRRKGGEEKEADKLQVLAKAGVEHILGLGKNLERDIYGHWPRMLEYAKEAFPEDEWWRGKLSEIRMIDERLAEDSDRTDPLDITTTSGDGRSNWKKLVFVALLFSSLALSSVALPWMSPDTMTKNTPPVIQKIASLRTSPNMELQDLAVKPTRGNADRLERENEELVSARFILREFYEPNRIKRPDQELA